MLYLARSRFVILGAFVAGCMPAPEPAATDATTTSQAAGTSGVVISQVYGGGGNSGAPFRNDFVELFNRDTISISIDGWSVQYASSNGSTSAKADVAGTIPPGGYYLVQLASGGATGANLPTADATGGMNMSGTSGTIALVANQTPLACGGSSGACLPDAAIRDLVGYGAASQFEGSGAAPALTTTTAAARAGHGCTDTDSNRADFSTVAPSPRSSASPTAACSGASDAGTADAPPPADASVPSDAPDNGDGDGTPTRLPCTSSFGNQMSGTFGRLDGFLVAIVNPGTSGCASDSGHVHLQIQMNGKIYNIAVDVMSTGGGSSEVSYEKLTHALIGGGWSEGWHTTGQQLDYVTNLATHSSDLVAKTKAQMITTLDTELAQANHVSIFTTGFNSTGGHLVHREGSNHDGAIVIDPLSANPEYLLVRFPEQSF